MSGQNFRTIHLIVVEVFQSGPMLLYLELELELELLAWLKKQKYLILMVDLFSQFKI